MTDKPDIYTVRLSIATEIKATATMDVPSALENLLHSLPEGTEVNTVSISRKGSYV